MEMNPRPSPCWVGSLTSICCFIVKHVNHSQVLRNMKILLFCFLLDFLLEHVHGSWWRFLELVLTLQRNPNSITTVMYLSKIFLVSGFLRNMLRLPTLNLMRIHQQILKGVRVEPVQLKGRELHGRVWKRRF